PAQRRAHLHPRLGRRALSRPHRDREPDVVGRLPAPRVLLARLVARDRPRAPRGDGPGSGPRADPPREREPDLRLRERLMAGPAPAGGVSDRVAVVPGGSRGMGAALAAALAGAGARVVISGRRRATLERTAQAIGALPVVADAAERASAREPVRQAL